MRKNNFFGIFFVLILLSFGILKFGFPSFILEKITAPLQSISFNFFSFPKNVFTNTDISKLKEENLMLSRKLVDQQKLIADNKALSDQFKTVSPKSQNLLAVKIIGAPSFIPQVSFPEFLVLDRGASDGIKVGQAVIYKDNLIGKISAVSENLSKVSILTGGQSSFTAKTLETQSLGIIRGQGNGEMIMDNILLSDNIKSSDIVLTKGDLDINGLGYPPDIVVGKIVSVEKKPSSLFQSAEVKSLIDFSKLTMVFIITGY